jgi:septal ring factor EnvC (AmiA/AmiB activator)
MKSVNIACRDCAAWATETEDARNERDELRAQLDTLKLYAQRTTAQLRDEERENEALRRRLRVGGR